MGESLSTAIIVSLIGMVTVFVILGLVVLTGKILIKTINTFFPIEEIKPEIPNLTVTKTTKKSFDKSTLAAIVSAIETISGGKAVITKIEKID